MFKLERSIDIERDPEEVFGLISDPLRYPEFFVGITKWELVSEKHRGIGAEFRVLMRVGAIEAGGLIRITDWQEPRTIAWRAEQGVRQHGRWTVTAKEDGPTRLTLELAYDIGGGLPGRMVEWIVSRVVGGNMEATLLATRRILVHDEKPSLPVPTP